MSDNMKIWDAVCETDPANTKKMTHGAKLTTIAAYSQIKRATELWGPFGGKWGPCDETLEFALDGMLLLYQATFVYPDGSFPIRSTVKVIWGGNNVDHDCAKKVATDALTKGLSFLGFNADVFMGRFDDSKYFEDMEAKFRKTDKAKPTDPITRQQWHNLLGVANGKGLLEKESREMYEAYSKKHLKGIKPEEITQHTYAEMVENIDEIHSEYMKDSVE